MNSRTITVTYKQEIETVAPGVTVEVVFVVEATIKTDENGNEISIVFNPVMNYYVECGRFIKLPMPTEQTRDGRKFLGLMRDAARKEAYRLDNPKPTMSEMFRPGKPERNFVE